MKKALCLTITLFCVLLVTAQQNVNLKFTATYSDGTYHPFDYISVTNVTRGWNELLAYPDTTMSLTYDGLFENYTNGGLTEAFPNPFYGKADVMFSMDRTGIITAKLLTISGKVLSEYSGYVEEGSHQITINIDKPQIAFLFVKTHENQYIKKVLNIGYGGRNSIIVNKTCDNEIVNKQRSGGEFVPGDVMSYIAISTESGNTLESNVITKEQYNSETISLLFPTPIVSTSNVLNITTNSAVSGGVVTSEGGSNVTARGVCWSTSQNPTINDSHTTDGSGMGPFISNITGLTGATTYYLRAYATNGAGTAYGSQASFTTEGDLPTISTKPVTNITTIAALSGGNITDDHGLNVTARGICWSTSQNPTITDNHTDDGSGMGQYDSNITGLSNNTRYYVRAYATNAAGTAYGAQKTFVTINPAPPEDAIDGLFSISEMQQVYFSKGNLQYQASTDWFTFANNQYDWISAYENMNISPTYDGWIDKFGWGTSGIDHGAVCYQPWSANTQYWNYYAYGDAIYDLNEQSGDADWGTAFGFYPGWRTLTKEEWSYVFNTRNTNSGIRYVKAQVCGVDGIVLLPDNWNSNIYSLNNINVGNVNYSSNIITSSVWNNTFEINGAVFLPAAGNRKGGGSGSNLNGYYWSATHSNNSNAYHLFFNTSNVNTEKPDTRDYGFSVRLVCNAKSSY